MMNTEKSGWTGKVKVALTITATLILSLVLMYCNSSVDEQMLQNTQTSSAIAADGEIDVPIIPATNFKLKDLTATINLAVDNNVVRVNDETVELDELASVLENESGEKDAVILTIDRAQRMSFVREVQREMRRAGRLKVLYIGQTQQGQRAEVPLLLPPLPQNASDIRVPAVDNEYARQHNLSLLKIEMGESSGSDKQQQVYDFVKEQLERQKTNYVVSARFNDNNTYNRYLESIYYLQEAFHQLYEERAQELYGEHYWDIREKAATDEKYAEMFSAIKEKIPMAISIAEN